MTKQEYEEEKPANPVKILVLVGDPRVFESYMPFLKDKGYEVAFARSIIEMIGQLPRFVPDVLLISWNTKRCNVKEVYKAMCEKLNAMVVVFSELSDPMSIDRLAKSGINKTLFPPLSAQAIHVRVQNLLQPHIDELSQNQRKADDLGCNVIDSQHVAEATQWSKVITSKNADADGVFLWKGKSLENDKTYFFEGLQTPEYSFSEKKWNAGTNKGLFMEAKDKTNVFVAAIEKGVEKNIEENPVIYFEKKISGVKNSHPLSVFEKGLREVLRSRGISILQSTKQFPLTTQATCEIIKSNRFTGFLFTFNSSNTFDPDLLSKVYDDLCLQMKTYGEILYPVTDPVIIEVESDIFREFVDKNSNFLVTTKCKNDEVVFAFVEAKEMPVLYEAEVNNVLGCDAEKILLPNSLLSFDLHLWLPKNKKLILYLKKGTLIIQKFLGKLFKRPLSRIYFKNEEKDLFYAYFIKNKVINNFEKNEKKVG